MSILLDTTQICVEEDFDCEMATQQDIEEPLALDDLLMNTLLEIEDSDNIMPLPQGAAEEQQVETSSSVCAGVGDSNTLIDADTSLSINYAESIDLIKMSENLLRGIEKKDEHFQTIKNGNGDIDSLIALFEHGLDSNEEASVCEALKQLREFKEKSSSVLRWLSDQDDFVKGKTDVCCGYLLKNITLISGLKELVDEKSILSDQHSVMKLSCPNRNPGSNVIPGSWALVIFYPSDTSNDSGKSFFGGKPCIPKEVRLFKANQDGAEDAGSGAFHYIRGAKQRGESQNKGYRYTHVLLLMYICVCSGVQIYLFALELESSILHMLFKIKMQYIYICVLLTFLLDLHFIAPPPFSLSLSLSLHHKFYHPQADWPKIRKPSTDNSYISRRC
jgi:hypothetical protein